MLNPKLVVAHLLKYFVWKTVIPYTILTCLLIAKYWVQLVIYQHAKCKIPLKGKHTNLQSWGERLPLSHPVHFLLRPPKPPQLTTREVQLEHTSCKSGVVHMSLTSASTGWSKHKGYHEKWASRFFSMTVLKLFNEFFFYGLKPWSLSGEEAKLNYSNSNSMSCQSNKHLSNVNQTLLTFHEILAGW